MCSTLFSSRHTSSSSTLSTGVSSPAPTGSSSSSRHGRHVTRWGLAFFFRQYFFVHAQSVGGQRGLIERVAGKDPAGAIDLPSFDCRRGMTVERRCEREAMRGGTSPRECPSSEGGGGGDKPSGEGRPRTMFFVPEMQGGIARILFPHLYSIMCFLFVILANKSVVPYIFFESEA